MEEVKYTIIGGDSLPDEVKEAGKRFAKEAIQEEKKDKVIESENLFVPERMENESYSDYKERRLVANYKLHQMAKGKLIWDSAQQGTYRK